MVRYGIYYALGFIAAGAAITWLVGWPAAVPFYLLAVFCLNFFRDPERTVPAGAVAVSPADGKVIGVHADDAGGGNVNIFMNVFDVHVNRTPIAGRIAKIEYKKGQFLDASVRRRQPPERAEHRNGRRRIQWPRDARRLFPDRRAHRAAHHFL